MRLIVAAPQLAGRWKVGDSIAVNGVCLTAVDMAAADEPHPGRFAADLAQETVLRTTLTHLKPGSMVNLELPTKAGAPLGGHVVQGHVDGTGTLVALVPLHQDLDHTDWRMIIEVPPELARDIIPQGSVTIDGISLTVARMEGHRIEIAVIPHTYKAANLHSLLSGARVNIETDVLSKYAARREAEEQRSAEMPTVASSLPNSGQFADAAPRGPLTIEYLLANGY